MLQGYWLMAHGKVRAGVDAEGPFNAFSHDAEPARGPLGIVPFGFFVTPPQ